MHKRLLPNYDVFDEVRHFRPGDAALALADRIAESVDCPALLVHTPDLEQPGVVTRAVQWLVN